MVIKVSYKQTVFCRYLIQRTSKINMSSNVCNIAVCQLTSTNDKTENFKIVQRLVAEAAQKQAKVFYLFSA